MYQYFYKDLPLLFPFFRPGCKRTYFPFSNSLFVGTMLHKDLPVNRTVSCISLGMTSRTMFNRPYMTCMQDIHYFYKVSPTSPQNIPAKGDLPICNCFHESTCF